MSIDDIHRELAAIWDEIEVCLGTGGDRQYTLENVQGRISDLTHKL